MMVLIDCTRFPCTLFSFSTREIVKDKSDLRIKFRSMYSSIERIVEKWIHQVSKELPPEFLEVLDKKIRVLLLEVLTGRKSVEDSVEEIDENIIKKFVKSGRKPTDFLRRMEKLLMISYSELNDPIDFSRIIPVLTRFETELLQKIMKVYETMMYEEIGTRRKVEKALRILTRVYESIIKEENEKKLFEKVCKIIVEEGYAHAWIGFPKKDGSVEAIAGYGSDYFKTIEVRWDSSELGKGPTGTAIREKRTVTLKSVYSTGYIWRSDAVRCGFKSSIAIPMMYRNRLFGVLNIYSYEEDAFDEEITKLLERVASNISYAIFSIRTDEEKKKAMEQIERNIEHFAFLVDGIRNPLTAIKGYVEMYVDDEDVRKKIYAQIDRILQLLDNLDEGWFKSKKVKKKSTIIPGNEDGGKPKNSDCGR